jgi:hypothetical protein
MSRVLAREPDDIRIDEPADIARPVEIVHLLHRLDEIADDGRLDRALVIEDVKLPIIVVRRGDVGGAQAGALDQNVDRLAAMSVIIEPVDALGHGGEKAEQKRLVLLGPGNVGRIGGEGQAVRVVGDVCEVRQADALRLEAGRWHQQRGIDRTR